MFTFVKDQEFSIEKKRIAFVLSILKHHELGVLYRNICDWFQRIWDNQSDNEQNTQKKSWREERVILIKIRKQSK